MNDTQSSIMSIASYVCDHICQKPSEITDQEELEDYCNGVCQLPTHLCHIMNQYSKRNDGCSYGKRCPTRTPENKGCD